MIQQQSAPEAINQPERRVLQRWQKSLTDFLVRKTIPENPGGFTLDPGTRSAPPFDVDTYFVSLNDFERRCSLIPTVAEISAWISLANAALRMPGHHVGGWLDNSTNEFVLDVSVPISGLAAAKAFGHKNGQDSIYHPATRRSIPLYHRIRQVVPRTEEAA